MKELEAKAKELKELQILQGELEAEIEAAKEAIKAAMGDREEVIAGPYKICYKPISTTRLDSRAIMEAVPDFCQRYIKTSTTRRLTVA